MPQPSNRFDEASVLRPTVVRLGWPFIWRWTGETVGRIGLCAAATAALNRNTRSARAVIKVPREQVLRDALHSAIDREFTTRRIHPFWIAYFSGSLWSRICRYVGRDGRLEMQSATPTDPRGGPVYTIRHDGSFLILEPKAQSTEPPVLSRHLLQRGAVAS